MASKGVFFEEVVREFLFKEGYFALRGVSFRTMANDVTDIDIWLYGKVGNARTTTVVDAKNKKTPKAFERILWAKGLQSIVKADRAIVATTDTNAIVAKFAAENSIQILTKNFVDTTEASKDAEQRISFEQFVAEVKSYQFQKEDGDWLFRIHDAKSSLVSLPGFQSFNRAVNHFRFFGERLVTRPQLEGIALRCILMCASVAAVALDIALTELQFSDARTREQMIKSGIIYGEGNSDRIRTTISRVLNLVETSVENGPVIGRQIAKSLEIQFQNIRADIISEYFVNTARSDELFRASRDLDRLAFSNGEARVDVPSSTKAIVGILADFVSIPRSTIFQKLGFSGAEPPRRDEVQRQKRLF